MVENKNKIYHSLVKEKAFLMLSLSVSLSVSTEFYLQTEAMLLPLYLQTIS